jgi:hypothetical protein
MVTATPAPARHHDGEAVAMKSSPPGEPQTSVSGKRPRGSAGSGRLTWAGGARKNAPPLCARLRSLLVLPSARAPDAGRGAGRLVLGSVPSVPWLALGRAVVAGVREGRDSGGVVAVDVRAANAGCLSCHDAGAADGDRGVGCWRRGEVVGLPGRSIARQRGYGGCQGRGSYAGNARRGSVGGMRRH